MYEIVLTRIFSVTMWYHFAFVAISVALFGTTVGALIVHLRPDSFTQDKVERQMWRYSLGFGVSVALAFLIQLAIPFVQRMSAAGVASIVLTCVVISVPFMCSGVVVALALTRFQRVNRLYAADLVGAGLGCVALVVVFRWIDGPSLVIAIAAAACLGSLLLAVAAGINVAKVASTVVLVVLAATTVFNVHKHDQGNPFIRVLWAKEEQDTLHTMDRWNAFSRITVDGQPTDIGWPAGYGMSRELPGEIVVPQMSMLIDGTAGTMITGYDGSDERTDFLRYDVTNLGYYGLDDGFESAVIGVGGGRDVLSGLEFGADRVTGIEINNNILDIVTNDLRRLHQPEVRPAGPPGQRRGPQLADPVRRPVRHDPDVADRHLGRLVGRGLRPVGELALHDRRLEHVLRPHRRRRDAVGLPLVLGDRPPAVRDPAHRGAGRPRCSTQRGAENPRDHVLIFEARPPSSGPRPPRSSCRRSRSPRSGSTRSPRRPRPRLHHDPHADSVSEGYPAFADWWRPVAPTRG